MFLHFFAFEHVRRNQPEIFNGLVWTWEISPKKERVLLTNFRKLSNWCFKINYDEPLNKRISKLKCILYTLNITHFKNTKYFLLHAVWYEDRAIQLLKFSMSQEVKKGLLRLWLLRALQIFFSVFPGINVMLFTYYQR